jgi:hypothetical protein
MKAWSEQSCQRRCFYGTCVQASRPLARSSIYNTPSREFSGLLKYMGWALAFCLVQSRVNGFKRFFFVGFKQIKYTGEPCFEKSSLVSAEPNDSAAAPPLAEPTRQ